MWLKKNISMKGYYFHCFSRLVIFFAGCPLVLLKFPFLLVISSIFKPWQLRGDFSQRQRWAIATSSSYIHLHMCIYSFQCTHVWASSCDRLHTGVQSTLFKKEHSSEGNGVAFYLENADQFQPRNILKLEFLGIFFSPVRQLKDGKRVLYGHWHLMLLEILGQIHL